MQHDAHTHICEWDVHVVLLGYVYVDIGVWHVRIYVVVSWYMLTHTYAYMTYSSRWGSTCFLPPSLQRTLVL